MGLQDYFNNYATQPSRWADPDHEVCACRGWGWFHSEVDTFHECPHHFSGQMHNECEPHDLEEAKSWHRRDLAALRVNSKRTALYRMPRLTPQPEAVEWPTILHEGDYIPF